MTQAQWLAYTDATTLNQQAEQDDLFLNQFKDRQAALDKAEYDRRNTPDDADSADAWRLKGGDSPEVFHDIHSTGTAANARSKVYKQIAYANGISIDEAVALVDGQAEAYKADQAYRASEQFQIDKAMNPSDAYFQGDNMSDAIADFRKAGIATGDLTSFDIYNAGDKAVQAAERDAVLNPESALSRSNQFLTGEKGAFGRDLADNQEYVNRQIASGYMEAGSTDPKRYKVQRVAQKKAKKLGRGLYGEENVDPRVMEAIHETSYGKWANENLDANGKYRDSGVIGRAANVFKSAGATIAGAGYGMVDAFSELTGWATDGAIGGNIATSEEIDEWANELTGYDNYYVGKAADEIKDSFKRYQEDGDLVALIMDGGIAGLKAAPEAAAASLAFVATLYAPGKALQGITTIGKVMKAETAGLSVVEATAKSKAVLEGATTLQKVIYHGSGQAGFVGASMASTSDDMDAYKEETGDEMGIWRLMGSMGINMVMHNLDGMIDKGIITKEGIGSETVRKLLMGASDVSKVKLAKELTARGFGVAADTLVKEMPTEIIQAGMEAVSKQYGTRESYVDENGQVHLGAKKSVGDILTSQETKEEMVVSALMTPGSVVGMKGAGSAIPAIKKVKDVAFPETEVTKEVKKSVKVEEKKYAEVVTASIDVIDELDKAGEAGGINKILVEFMSIDAELEAMADSKAKTALQEKVWAKQTEIKEKYIKPAVDVVEDDGMKTLGAEAADLIKSLGTETGGTTDNSAIYSDLVNAIESSVGDNQLVRDKLLEIAETLNVETVAAEAIIEDKIVMQKITKTLEQVEEEVMTGDRGYLTYMKQIAKFKYDRTPEGQQAHRSYVDKLISFEMSQTDKADRLEEGINKAVKMVEAIVKNLQDEKKITFEAALEQIANEKNEELLEIEYSDQDNVKPFGINKHETVRHMQGEKDVGGVFKTVEAIRESSKAMVVWGKNNGIDLRDENIVAAAKETKDVNKTLVDSKYDLAAAKKELVSVERKLTVEKTKAASTEFDQLEAKRRMLVNKVAKLAKEVNLAERKQAETTKPSEVKEEIKTEPTPKTEPKVEPRVEPKTEPKIEPKVEVQKEEVQKEEMQKEEVVPPVKKEIGKDKVPEKIEEQFPIPEQYPEEVVYEEIPNENLAEEIALDETVEEVIADEDKDYTRAQLAKIDGYLEDYTAELDKLQSEKAGIKLAIKNHKKMMFRYKAKWTRAKQAKTQTFVHSVVAMINKEVKRFILLIAKHSKAIIGKAGKLIEINRQIRDVRKKIDMIQETRDDTVESYKISTVDGILKDAKFGTASALFEIRKSGGVSMLEIQGELQDKMNQKVNRVVKLLDGIVQDYNAGKKEHFMQKDSPARMFLGQDGKFDRKIAEAIAIEIISYIAEKSGELAYNDDNAIKKMLGAKNSATLTPDVRNALVEAGSLYKLEAASIGKNVVRNIGIQQKGTAPQYTQQKVESDFGAITLAVMEQLMIVEYNTDMTQTEFNGYKNGVNGTNLTSNPKVKVPMIRQGQGSTVTTKKANQVLLDELTEALDIEVRNKKPRVRKRKGDREFFVRGLENETDVPKKQQKVLNHLEKIAYKVDVSRVDKLRKLYKKDSGRVLRMFGWVDPESVHIDKKDFVVAKNNTVVSSLEDIFEYRDEVGGKSIYFDWFFSKNGRFFIDSTRINPQTNKVHRFLMAPEGQSTIGDESSRDMFKQGVVQAFDGDPDRQAVTLDTGEIVEDLGAIDKQSIESTRKDFERLMELYSKAIADVKAGNMTEAVMTAIEGTDHPTHALMALEEMGKYNRSTEFKTRMTLETDAVTSGFILGIITSPVMSYTKTQKWAAKGGVWIGGTDVSSFGEYIEDPDVLDSYEESAAGVNKVLEGSTDSRLPILRKWVDVNRKFMKFPFMYFIYGAGMDGIKTSMGVEYADKLLAGLSNPETVVAAYQMAKELNLIVEFPGVKKNMSPERMAKLFRTTSVLGTTEENTALAKLHMDMAQVIEDTYGEAVSEYMSSEFAEIVAMRKVVNKSFVLMFNEFKAEFDAKIAESDGSKDAVDVVLAKMVEEGKVPGIMTVNSEDVSEKAVIASNNVVTLEDQKVSTHFKAAGERKAQRVVNPMIRELVESPAAGAVVNIHWLDGAIISAVLGRYNSLGVHDAIVVAVTEALVGSKDYNTETWALTQEFNMVDEIVKELKKLPVSKGANGKELTETVTALEEIAQTITGHKGQMERDGASIGHMSFHGNIVDVKGMKAIDSDAKQLLGKYFSTIKSGMKAELKAFNAIVTRIKEFKDC